MRRLPGILLLTGAALVVIAALLVSGLRIALPHLDAWRPEILNKIESATGMPVEASQLSASWQNFGPTLEAHDIRAELKDGGEFSVKRVTLALDVWQSLLHMRWQFRDLNPKQWEEIDRQTAQSGPFWKASKSEWVDSLKPQPGFASSNLLHYLVFTADAVIEFLTDEVPHLSWLDNFFGDAV